MRAWAVVAVLLACGGCFKAWEVSGPWACAADGGCADGLTCDDGVCCQPGGTPACPTLPINGGCPSGVAPTFFYPDRDGDTFGDGLAGRLFCGRPLRAAWVADAGDCNDLDPAISPVAPERCNGLDDNCNGVIDEGRTPRTSWYLDLDQDGFGDDSVSVQACAQPPGYAARGGDCAPLDAGVYPGAPERCNDADDNCNGLKDDAPLVDVENPGLTGPAFDCQTGLAGVCAPGGLQCLVDTAGHFAKACVARALPSTDVCGDGLDNDCDGQPDDAPGCGGPRALLDVPGATYAAVRVATDGGATAAKLPQRCLAHEPGAQGDAWLNPVFVGSKSDRHIWSVEAASGFFWDLSQPTASLFLAFDTTGVVGPGGSPWNAAWLSSPVVTLCGPDDTQYRRYVPDGSHLLPSTGAGAWSATLPVGSAPSGWSVETGPGGFDASVVTRVEVVVSPQDAPDGGFAFTLHFSRDAGFR
jgi:hypothetical protein